uniref:DUF834 domain-containing protein n=1 Tax=Oryza sativa subsp. japonica TaxID=39947 RepID=Q6YS22_ORYSJ|nr:hypothetical protein [Oryza sativa Japonica Group]BAD32098.1 hypothetical protein [Oryza sativa Japonica Group]
MAHGSSAATGDDRRRAAARSEGGRGEKGGEGVFTARSGRRERRRRRSTGEELEREGKVTTRGIAGQRRQQWRSSPVHDERWLPVADFDGGGVDGVALGLANPTVATARLGGGSNGGER